MKALTKILLISMFLTGGIAQASQCPGTNVIEDPPVFQWSGNEGTLEIGEASFVIGGETLTTRAFRQEGGQFSIPGPTMYMSPGQTYVLTFKNSLPFEEPSPEHNTLKDPNISNIHTHGLHVSGETPGDDVTRLIQGGFCGDYVYELGPDHMGGTNWYHPHHHGSTWLQVAGGALGMLIVDDSGDGIPQGVAAMNERLLAVGFIEPGVVAGNGGDTLISGTFSSGWTVNGNVQGNLCTPVNEWQHWRVLLADPDAKMKDVEIGPECEAVLMARDGVWRTTAPMPLVNNTISLTGASRADLAVRCSADSTITVGNTVVANIFADPNLPSDQTVGPYANGATGGMWQAMRPSYLRDLRGESVDYTDSISVGARSLYNQSYDENVPIFDLLPGIQEWAIGANNHPFHLHVYHQQVQGVCSGGDFEDGEYYDTISGSCDIRFDTDPTTTTSYDGRTIMHCHILQHEDNGAMGWAAADFGGIPAPTLPPGKQVLYACGGGCTPVTEGPFGDATCGDTIDNDCDGLIDADDPDCQDTGGSCSTIMDRNTCRNTPDCEWLGGKNNGMCVDAAVCTITAPNEIGLCGDGIDNDCDGVTDCADTADCGSDPVCQTPDCSVYGTRQECNNEPTDTCKWNNKNAVCLSK